MAKKFSRLILSFIGKHDISKKDLEDLKDIGPIRRVLMALANRKSVFKDHVPDKTTLLLLDDHQPPKGDDFVQQLQQELPQIGLPRLRIEREFIELPNGPTDFHDLYKKVWKAIPTYGEQSASEVIFNLSSGTPAMQTTLVLASQALPLKTVRLVESSREHDAHEYGVCEVVPPYVIAVRDVKPNDKRTKPAQLSATARQQLLPDTVIEDAQVEAIYAALYRAVQAAQKGRRTWVLVSGPIGSGKWHACQQFARWYQHQNKHEKTEWLNATSLAQFADMSLNALLLVRRIDTWSDKEREQLRFQAEQRPDVVIVTSVLANQGTTLNEILPGATIIAELPPLGARADIIELACALARQMGIVEGKLKERFQYELLGDRYLYANNLHDLRTLLATIDAHSAGKHPERNAYLAYQGQSKSSAVLQEAMTIIDEKDFGPNRHRLDDVLDVIRLAMVDHMFHQVHRPTQEEIGDLLGLKQQRVSELLKELRQQPLKLRLRPNE